MGPNDQQALEFAIMLQAGLPATEAILYFIDADDPNEVRMVLNKWQRSAAVKRASASLMKRPWQLMNLDERISTALDQHYSSLAYILFSRNYVEASQTEKSKLDTARQALEAKVAGTAGKSDALSRFYDDLSSGRIKLASTPPKLN